MPVLSARPRLSPVRELESPEPDPFSPDAYGKSTRHLRVHHDTLWHWDARTLGEVKTRMCSVCQSITPEYAMQLVSQPDVIVQRAGRYARFELMEMQFLFSLEHLIDCEDWVREEVQRAIQA